jgi:hypothetical protein
MEITGRTTKTQSLKFGILCLNLFIIGLSIPKIYFFFVILLPATLSFFGYLRIPKYIFKYPINLISTMSLVLFMILNYYQVYVYNLLDDTMKIIGTIIMTITLFLVGISLDLKKMPFFPYNILAVNISIFSGGIIWVFLSVGLYNRWSFSVIDILVSQRKVPSIWRLDESVNGPSLDIFSYLGLSLVGVLICGLKYYLPFLKRSFRGSILLLTILIFVCMSLYSSISLGARTPIIVLLLSVIATLIFTLSKDLELSGNIGYGYIYIVFYFFIGFIFYLLLSSDYIDTLTSMGIGSRLQSQGLETPRYEAWQQAISQMWDFPWGGRSLKLDIEFVHNLWLDQMYDAGILPMLLLLTFHIAQIPVIIRFLKLKLPIIIHVFVLCTIFAFLAAFMQAPVIQANPLFFAISCFSFGTWARLTCDFKYTKSG